MLPKAGEVAVNKPQTAQAAALYRIESISDSSPAPRPDMEGWVHFARAAEEAGLDSILVSFSRYEPDPLVVSCALGMATSKLKFIAAYRSGLINPTSFVQQVNTISALIPGRLSVNIVAGSSTEEQRWLWRFSRARREIRPRRRVFGGLQFLLARGGRS